MLREAVGGRLCVWKLSTALVQLHNVRVHIVYTMVIVGLIDGLEYSTNPEMWLSF